MKSIRPARRRRVRGAAAIALGLVVAGCSGADVSYETPPATKSEARATVSDANGSIFGGEGLNLFGNDKNKGATGAAIPVNNLLWRASLDTLSFMPLASADPFGGVIITDWYKPEESANERFKMTVYILSRQLRADGLKVAVFRQVRDPSGEWVDATVSEATRTELENAILTRARELRIAGLAE